MCSPLVFLLVIAASASPLGSPHEERDIDKLFCKVNIAIISALKKGPAATSYCSSFLCIPTKTLSATVTSTPPPNYATKVTTVTGDAITNTITITNSATVDTTMIVTETTTLTETTTSITSTSTLTCLNSAYTAQPIVGTLAKRGYGVPKPTCIPGGWDEGHISKACSCLAIPTPSTTITSTTTLAPITISTTATQVITPTSDVTEATTKTAVNTIMTTVTETKTTTLTAYAEATTIASNGVTYRKYTHNYNANLANSGFTSSTFKTLPVEFRGTINTLTFSSPNWPSGSTQLQLPDRPSPFESSQSALLLQGFFIAKESGTYTLSSTADSIDNWGYLWTGDNAYSAWSDSNADFKASRTGAGFFGGSKQISLNQGDAIPLTWLWANGGGVAQSYFGIKSPSGAFTTNGAGYFIQACSTEVFT